MKLSFRSPVFALSFLCYAAAAHAQAPLFNSHDTHKSLLWPAGWAPAAFTRTTSGDFTGEGSLDVVTMSGTQAVISWNIAHHNFQHFLPTHDNPIQLNDIDTFGKGDNPGRDSVAFVNSQGLGCLVFSEAAQQFEALMITGGPWANARRVACADIDGDGDNDFAGIAADQLHVVWRLSGGAPSQQEITLNVAALDVTLVHWSDTTRRDIAVLTQDGMRIYGTNSPPTNFAEPPEVGLTGVVMTVVPAADVPNSSGLDSVAVIYAENVGTPSRSLYVYNALASNGVASVVSLPSQMTFVGITSGDGDGDGDNDLVLAQKRELGPLYCANNNGAFDAPSSWNSNFIIDQFHTIPLVETDDPTHDPLRGPPAGNNESVPVFRDFTDDGKADLVLALPETPPVELESPVPAAHSFLENVTAGGTVSLSLNFFSSGALFSFGTESPIQLGGHIGFSPSIPAFDPGNANAVRLTIHRQPNIDTPQFAPAVSTAVISLQQHITSGALFDEETYVVYIPITALLDANDDWIAQVTGTSLRREIFWVELQPLRINLDVPTGNYTIDHSWATRIGAMVSDLRDYCEFTQEQSYTGTMVEIGIAAPLNCLETNGWIRLDPNQDPASCPGTYLFVGPIIAPGIIGRRRLPPESFAGTEYPGGETLVSGTISNLYATIPE